MLRMESKPLMTRIFDLLLCLTLMTAIQPPLFAQESKGLYDNLVPQFLLGLVHAPEIHKDLKLSHKQVSELETTLRKVDAEWFPARNLPADSLRAITVRLESQVWDWFSNNATEQQRQRLWQLECYAQGSRTLLREDIAEKVRLEASQQKKLAALAIATDESRRALAAIPFGDARRKELQDRVEKTTKAEQAGLMKIVRSEQRETLKSLLGDPFDPTRLNRIYALAPEFAPVEHWVNSSPRTMREMQGKVVLLHFYAFQCHNCHANFPIYQRWHKELTDKGVIVIGIQTPETNRERDPDAVKAAAKERDLKFPILIDLKSENWKAWGNTMWPCVYVIDKQGYIRLWWPGELNWNGATGDKTIEQTVEKLLAEE